MPIQQMLLGAGAVGAVEYSASNNQTNIDLATVFGSDWAADKDKIYIIPSGVTVGGTGSNPAILAPTNMGGTLVIENSGSIIGKGGSRGNGGYSPGGYQRITVYVNNGDAGGAGGNAIDIRSANVTVNNNSGGQISGGGGGGGGGGTGQIAYAYNFQWVGGHGGYGGYGEGYNQSQSNASSHPNQTGGYGGNGGNGGNGGTFGNAGTAGSQGQNAGTGQGQSRGYGGAGGAAGKAITSGNSSSWTNGTTAGTYHGSYT